MSVISDAIMQSMASQFDPMNGAVRDALATQTAKLQQDLISAQAETIARLEKLLEEAKASSASASIIHAYERLLAKASQ